MRKRTAILLFGTLFFTTANYIAWCLRPFYLPPPLEFVGDISPDGRAAAKEWRWSSGYARALPFSWSIAWANLRHPWNCLLADPVEITERADCGLWATGGGSFWGFSRTAGKWDPATASNRCFVASTSCIPLPLHDENFMRQGQIASRIDAMGARGATLEILALGRLSALGSLVRQSEESPDPDPSTTGDFHHYEILGRAAVTDPHERQRLLDGLARSIREAGIPLETPGWGISPRHGIVITHGDQRAEYFVNLDDGHGYAFGPAIEGIGGFYGGGGGKVSPSEAESYFPIDSRVRDGLDAVLDRHAIPRTSRAGE